MRLRPLDDRFLTLAASWTQAPENAKWLRFGPGISSLSDAALRVMRQRDLHRLRLYGPEPVAPAGLVALSDIDPEFGTATLWYVLGDRRCGSQGHTTRAVAALLEEAFAELSLGAVTAWVVEGNVASRRVLERNGFRLAGRHRRCHVVDGTARDRLLYDRLATDERSERGERGEHGERSEQGAYTDGRPA
jgi:RimJ/RimL family protein N-acetyltransferase